MRILLILILYFLWGGLLTVQAQPNKSVDSLMTLLDQSSDTARVTFLISLAQKVRYTDPAQSEKYANEALEISQQYGSIIGQARAQKELCRSFAEKGDYVTAVELGLEALRFFESVGEKEAVLDMYNGLGIINRYQNNYQQSVKYYQEALDLALALGKRQRLAGIYGNLGNVYFNLKEFATAKEFHLKSLKIDEEFDHDQGIASTYNNIANIEREEGNFEKALDYYHKSIEIDQKLGSIRNLAIGHGSVASISVALGNYTQGFEHALKSLSHAEKSESLRLKEVGLESLVGASKGLGDFEAAVTYQEQLQQLRDSIFNQDRTKQIAEMQAKYDTEKKEQQIASQEKEIVLLEEKKVADQRLRLSLILLAVSLLLLAAFIYSRYQLKRKSEARLQDKNADITKKNQEIEVMNQELERKALRAQMDPHFIFNSMNSIQHFITTNDKISALKSLSKFSKLIRQILDNSINHQVPIADEIKLLEYYIQLESLRFDHPFEHEIEIDESLDIYDTEIPFLLIQPYVENAIIHGLNHKDKKGHLKVKLQDGEEHILCTVEDDGVGREKAAQLKKGRNYISRGMNVTSRRLELLNRNKKNKTLVEVADLYDQDRQVVGTKVEIKIPLEAS